MPRKKPFIPINQFEGEDHPGISIERMVLEDLPSFQGDDQAERHDRHTFHLLEQGTVTIEIDFQRYEMTAPALIYMHPDQVHRILTFDNVTVNSWAINNEHLNPTYLKLLHEINPAKPLTLDAATLALCCDAISLALKFSLQKGIQLYSSLVKDSCNALVALAISRYLESQPTANSISRFEIISKAFKEVLEKNYTHEKRPAVYAAQLHVSGPYLNECVKNATGYPVTYHIQQRVMLEAKRLLYHSSLSVKEIAAELGYEDYPYFSRLFSKLTGMSALTFRRKNLE